jgi:hypothetical protein
MFYFFLALFYLIDVINDVKKWFTCGALRNIIIDILTFVQSFIDFLWKWIGVERGENGVVIVNKEIVLSDTKPVAPIEKIYTFTIKEQVISDKDVHLSRPTEDYKVD